MIKQCCLICHKDMATEGNLMEMLFSDDVVCKACREDLIPFPKTVKLKGIRIESLYIYEGKMRELILLYKEKMDEALYPLFLFPYIASLKRKYRDYVVVPVPSSKEALAKRGFEHVRLMFSVLDLPIADVLIKKESLEQKTQSRYDRNEVSRFIELRHPEEIQNRKVLLVDDILTTGATMLACRRCLEGKCARIECLTLCYNRRFLSPIEKKIHALLTFK